MIPAWQVTEAFDEALWYIRIMFCKKVHIVEIIWITFQIPFWIFQNSTFIPVFVKLSWYFPFPTAKLQCGFKLWILMPMETLNIFCPVVEIGILRFVIEVCTVQSYFLLLQTDETVTDIEVHQYGTNLY